MIKYKTGDILSATETIIGHQVNCFGAVGGLAAAVFDKYPDAERDYMQLCEWRKRKFNPLGITHLTGQQKDGHIIANIFGQYIPGADYRPEELENALTMLGIAARVNDLSVALPYKLSCGICGGDWQEVKKIIEVTMEDVDCTIYRREVDR